jgi:2-isopropylmalate synthase
VTRVSVKPKAGGVNDVASLHAQDGVFKDRKFSGSGSDTDIITSSARAYVSALNKLLSWNARRIQEVEGSTGEANGGVGDAQLAGPMPVSIVEL